MKAVASLKFLNKVYTKAFSVNNFDYTDKLSQLNDQDTYELLKKTMGSEKPAMVCRIGNVEMNCLLHYQSIHQQKGTLQKALNYIQGRTLPFWWDDGIKHYMSNNAGFINPTDAALDRFCERMLDDMSYLDILGSWLKGEAYFDQYMPQAKKVKISMLAPWNYKDPWTEVLRDKKVLIVHPYEKSVKAQFAKRELLFKDDRMLPPFKLETVQAVQSIAGNPTGFNDWFDALYYMEDEISKKDFDIAILGCGAYGFPLAAFVKRLGKKALNLGGATQILFGIKGKRWRDHHVESAMFNEYWSDPLPEEIPSKFKSIEGGAYW